jgi:addiction module HigA family antidote
MPAKRNPIPPGEILLEEFLRPLGISRNQLARSLHVPVGRIHDIIHARRSITADTATRLGIYFGTGPEVWLNLQAAYEVRLAKRNYLPALSRRIRPHAA